MSMRNFEASKHHILIASYLNKVVSGDIKRLIISMPPRHGKSEMASIRLPAFILGRLPQSQIIGASYSSTLANKVSRNIQKIIESDDYQKIFPATKLGRVNSRVIDAMTKKTAVEFEIVGFKGSYRAAGIGGGITGTGADFLIIDDPIKNRQEAESKVKREAIWDWYTSTAYTRLEKGGAVILIMTRWHEDDLAGKLLKLAKEDPKADQWEVLTLEAMAESKFEYDWREDGEALWPNKYDIEALSKMKASMGAYDWNSLYQQNPKPSDGGLFKRSWWKFYDEIPLDRQMTVQFWDCAQKIGISNDYTVCATWIKTPAGFYLKDLWRKKVEAPQLQSAVLALYEKHKPNSVVIEDKSSGSSLIQYLRQQSSIPVLAYDPKQRDKQIRASVATPQVEAGNCYLPRRAEWLEDFVDEHERFPFANHDDIVDTTSMMVEYFQGRSFNSARVRSL